MNLVEKAISDFNGAVKNTKNIEDYIPWYWILAWKFAEQYASPNEKSKKYNPEAYELIYNHIFNFFKDLEENEKTRS